MLALSDGHQWLQILLLQVLSLNRNSFSFLELWIQDFRTKIWAKISGQRGSRAHALELGSGTFEPAGLRVVARASLKEQQGVSKILSKQ